MSSTETALVRVESAPGGLVTREYLDEKAALVRQLYAPDTSDLEFEHFVDTCVARGLNPLAKQIYCVSRYDKKAGRKVATIQTGIDGFRLIAQRSGQYRGQVGPHWCGADGVWVEVWLSKEPPAAARVGVLREGFTAPLYGVARWASYAQEGTFWQRMGDVMLAKCAESLALRKAFPEELSGLYTTEEMSQTRGGRDSAEPKLIDGLTGEVIERAPREADLPATVGDPAPEPAPVKLVTRAQVVRMFAIASESKIPEETVKQIIMNVAGVESSKAIPAAKYDAVIDAIAQEALDLDAGHTEEAPPEEPVTGQVVLEQLKAKDDAA